LNHCVDYVILGMFTSVEMDISASEIDVRILDSTQVYSKTVAERLKKMP